MADRRRRGRPAATSRPSCARRCEAERDRYRARARAARRRRRRPAAPVPARRPPRGGSRWPPPRRPTRCCRCSRPGRACACSSTPACARTGAASAGTAASGCPSAPTRRAWSGALAEAGVGWFCVDQSAHLERPARGAGAGRHRRRPGRAADRLGGDLLALGARRLPLRPRLRPVRRQIAARDAALADRRRRLRPGGGAPRAARRQAGEFLAAVAARLRALRREPRPPRPDRLRDRHRAARPLVVGGAALAGGGARRRRRGRASAPSTCRPRWPSTSRSSARSTPRPGARARTSAPGTRRRSPTSPGRRGGSSCACCARSARGLRGDAAARAARELLAAQASDWAFLDSRGQAGDYAFVRATDHGEALLRGNRVPMRHRSAYAFARAGPQPRPAAGALDGRQPALDPRPDPLLGVPAADRGRPRPPRPQALRGAGRARGGGPRADPRRRGVAGPRARRRRPHPPHPRAQATDRPRRVRRLGRADELRHARRRGRARRRLRLRPRPRPRLAGRQRLRPPRPALRRAAGDDDPRHRVRPPPGLGREAPAVLHPRGRALDHQPLAAGDRLLPLHARADRRHLRGRGGADLGDPERDRPRRPAEPGRRRPSPACAPTSPRRTSASSC